MSEFKTEIIEASKELTLKEKIRCKNLMDALVIGKACKAEPLEIEVDYWVKIHVINDKCDDKEYDNYIIVDKDGVMYYTGSESFWRSFSVIWDEVKDTNEDWKLKVMNCPSKNREGQSFVTCTIV